MEIEPFTKKVKMSEQNSNETPTTLDAKALDRFSRQNAALGAEVTAKLTKMKILIFGLRGLGIETAKNLALQGSGSLTIVDSNPVTIQDIGLNFFLHEEDVGKVRSEVVLPRLQELNPICKMSRQPELSLDLISTHSALVVTLPLPLSELVRLDNFCREMKISFFFGLSAGVSSTIFVDHGSKHTIHDPNGERPLQKLISDVKVLSESNELLIRYETPEGQLPIAINDGHFQVTEVNGISGLNDLVLPATHPYKDPVKTVRVPFTVPTGEAYVSGGLLTEKKQPFDISMEPLATRLKSPADFEMTSTDLMSFSEVQQHVAFVSAMTYLERHGSFPRPGNEEDADALVALARELLENKTMEIPYFDLDADFLKTYSKFCGSELQPVSAFMGGVMAQEVVKCTGKFTPIPGFMFFTAREALPDEPVSQEDRAPRDSRYDNLAAVYGWPFVEKLGNLKYFMVGCGALGCEFMKNFSLNGVCCGPQGRLTVTDPDRIELSNLSRQFLFREHNVGQCKATAATAMAAIMNKDIKVNCFEQFVGLKTEGTFNDSFWMGLDGVCNALDNMEARLYVDQMCVKYEKSLLESGTMGTSGNVDTVAPFKTRTYAEGGNAAEGGGVPMCTLRNFPHLTDHCIEWARDQFELLFSKLAKVSEVYVQNPAAFEEDKLSKVEGETGAAIFDIRAVTSILRAAKSRTLGSCAQLAYDMFHFLFRDRILDLQAAFPPDSRLVEDGVDKGPFWNEKKRYPTAAVFNLSDDAHRNFLLSCTVLFGQMIGLLPPRDPSVENWAAKYLEPNWLNELSQCLVIPEYIQVPVVSADLSGPQVSSELKVELAQRLLAELRSVSSELSGGQSFEVADFEKDDDQNFHISFITSTANCRCDNYTIARTDFHACKIIAGKIIAAIATTTAAVCGLVILELFKLVLNKPTDAYMNRQIGLSTYTYTSFTQEPPRSKKTYTQISTPDDLPEEAYDEKGQVKEEFLVKEVKRAYPEDHNVWSKLTCPGSLTLKQFAEWLESEHKLKLQRWDFVYGLANGKDADEKTVIQPATTPVFPPPEILDYSHIPSLELTQAQATQQLMKNPAARGALQKYLKLWKDFKALGSIPPAPSSEHAITDATTLTEILHRMAHIGEEAEAKKIIQTKTVSSLAGRLFWVIPPDQVPQCLDVESGEEIENMCSLKILL